MFPLAEGQNETSTGPPTLSPTPFDYDDGNDNLNTTFAKECSAYSACAGLVDDCCPTAEGIFLYCCLEDASETGGVEYAKEFSLIDTTGDSVGGEAEYYQSTSAYSAEATVPGETDTVIQYNRSATEIYDFIYFKTSSIVNASDYVTGERKFYIELYSTAPVCTQVVLQLDNLEIANSSEYPIGRHSRYFAATTVQNAWERLEFDFLDRPDETLDDDAVDTIALFFSPAQAGVNTFYVKQLDSAIAGCTSDCMEHSTKTCSALFGGEAGSCEDGEDNDGDGLIDCQDPECTMDPVCASSILRAYANVKSQVRSEAATPDSSSRSTFGLEQVVSLMMALFLVVAL